MVWLYFSAGSVILFTTMSLLQRKIAVDSKYPRATAIVFNVYGAIFSLIIFLIAGGAKKLLWPQPTAAWVFMLTACIFYALFERGRFVAAKYLDASVFSIISSVSVVVAFIGSLFLYSEELTSKKLIGVVLTIIALVLVSIGKRIHKKISLKGVFIAILIWSILGLAWMLDKKGALYFTPDTYNILVWTIPLVFIYFPYVKTKEIVHEARNGSWKVILMAGINVVAYLLQLKALEIADATKVIPIVQISTLTTVLMGILILNEKEFLWRKMFAAFIAVGGIYLLVSA